MEYAKKNFLGVVTVCLCFIVSCSKPVNLINFPTADKALIYADLYLSQMGKQSKAVVLAHGAVFDKESWQPFAQKLSAAGWDVLALDFRGYGSSKVGQLGRKKLSLDINGAVTYLRKQGTDTVVVIGGSMGGRAALEAAKENREIDKVVALAPPLVINVERIQADLLLVVSDQDRMKGMAEAIFRRAGSNKKLVILPGKAHAQYIFATNQAEKLFEVILDFIEK